MEDQDNEANLSADGSSITESEPDEETTTRFIPIAESRLDLDPFPRPRSGKLRMPREDQIAYIVPQYLRRLRDTRKMMAEYLEKGDGTATEIQRRIDKLDELIGLVKTGTHEAAAEFVIKNGITSSLLQGGGGYPSLTGAHFDYITTCSPNRTREMRRRIGERGETAWSKKDRLPRLAS